MTLESQTFRTHTDSMRAGLRTTTQFWLVWNLSYLSHLKLYREWRHLPTQWSRKRHYRTRHLNFSFLCMRRFVFSLTTFKPAVTNIRTGTVSYSSQQVSLAPQVLPLLLLLGILPSLILDTFSKTSDKTFRSNKWNNRHIYVFPVFFTSNPTSELHFCTTRRLWNSLSTFLKFHSTEGLLLKW